MDPGGKTRACPEIVQRLEIRHGARPRSRGRACAFCNQVLVNQLPIPTTEMPIKTRNLESISPKRVYTWMPALGMVVVLGVYGLLRYGYVLQMSFVLDDFAILQKVQHATFGSLWSNDHPLYRWYRPWSRETHFWTLYQLFGLNAWAYRLVSLALWGGVLAAYYTLAERLRNKREAAIATCGVASLAAWGSTLGWVAGVQDLWMLLFGLIYLHLIVRRRDRLAVPALLLALLSKETAAVLPLVAVAYAMTVGRESSRAVLRRFGVHFVTLVAWALLHPYLLLRVLSQSGGEERIAAPANPILTFIRSACAAVNLDQWPRPDTGWTDALVGALPAVIVLTCGLAWALRRCAGDGMAPRRYRIFGAAWALLAIAPLFVPSVGFLAYYALLSLLGVWLVLATVVAPRPRVAIGLVAAVGLTQALHAHTPSFDWGNDWFLRRTEFFEGLLQRDLLERHPMLPPHSRIFLASVPDGTGIGQPWFTPAVQVWYRDSTLMSGLVRDYVPSRSRSEDVFLRFDNRENKWYETVRGPENVVKERKLNQSWEQDHGALAITLGKSGDWRGAAEETRKLIAVSPRTPQYAFNLAVCLGNLGDSAGMRHYGQLAESLRVATLNGGVP